MPPISPDLIQPQHATTFQLNSSGLAGFFGGDEAISAMNTAQIYEKRRFMGLYNSPGGFRMAKHYGRLAKSRLWRGFFPDVYMQPHEVFSMDGGPGKMCPDFLGAQTGVVLERTTHLGYLFFKKMRDEAKYEWVENSRPPTKPVKVTIVNLGDITLPEKNASRVPSIWPSIFDYRVLVLNLIPTLSSISASIVSALAGDWYAFSLILLGVVAHGAACFVLGSSRIRVDLVTPPEEGPRGDGLMTMEDHRVIVLGGEKEVFQVTRASIAVEFPDWVKRDDYSIVGACCLLLMLQLLVQLFLIPQATLFGQILFLSSFGVSWLYNTYLSAIDKEDLQREALKGGVWNVDTSDQKSVRGYEFANWTTMVIAMLYTLQPDRGTAEQLLNRLLPNLTEEWESFKKVLRETYLKDPKAHPPSAPKDASKIVQNMYSDWEDAMEFCKRNPRGDAVGSLTMGTEKRESQSPTGTYTL